MPALSLSNRNPTKTPASRARSLLHRIRPTLLSAPYGARLDAYSDPLESFTWPEEVTLETLGLAIAAARGLELIVLPIPETMSHQEISGLTTVTGRTAYVFYDADLSPLNREQTILHEYAHILHGDVRPESECSHARSMFDDPIEKRAERTGMRLLQVLHEKQGAKTHQQGSDVLAFFSGTDRGVI